MRTFNYTTVLDFLIANVKNYLSKGIISSAIHIHGKLQENVTFGIDNAAYFSELIDAVSLHVGGGVVLHTKTETDICESEEEPNGSPENSETDSFRN